MLIGLLALVWLAGDRPVGAQSNATWPNEPSWAQVGQVNDQPWDALTGNGWNWLRRASSQDPNIVADATAPLSPPNVLQMVFTPDMGYGNEPSVHWIELPWVEEIYTGWWIKLSPNWTCSLNEWCTHVTYLFAQDRVGQVYTAYYHPSEDQAGPPYRIGANTEWAPYFTHPWYPNVTTTWVYPGEWHRIEFYYKWETMPGVSGDGIIRWWVDGVLNGDYTNVHYPSERGFQEFQHAPTFGTPPAKQYMFVDHTHVSFP
jgi:hypothetical protein